MEALVNRYEPEVRIVVRSRLGAVLRPYVDTMDIVQSMHRSLLIGLRSDKFDISTPKNLLSLAVTMVNRKIAKKWRKHRRQDRLANSANADGDLTSLFASLLSGNTDHEREVDNNEQMNRILQSLSENERKLVELRLQGYSTADAARMLNVDTEYARVRLARMRKRLEESGFAASLL